MELDNAIIIALIVIILIVLSAFVFISSNNISIQNEPAVETGANSSVQLNASRANGTDIGITAPDSENNPDNQNNHDLNIESESVTSTESSAAQSTADDSSSASESTASDTPQAGQSEATYDPSDFD